MDEMKSKIAALAKLTKTPDEIMAEKRAELEREIAKCEKWNRSWWRRYAEWRLESLNGQDFTDMPSLIGSWALASILTALCVLGIVLWSPFFNAAGVLAAIIVICHVFLNRRDSLEEDEVEFNITKIGWGLLRLLFFPFMPFVRIADLVILRAKKRTWDHYNRHPVAEMQTLMDSSVEIVPHYYTRGIEDAREELLGEASELRVTEKDLGQRRERIQRQIQQLAARMGHAQDDPPRKALLKQAYDALTDRRSRIRSTLERVQETIAKTSAILDECKATVSKLRGPIGDAILLAEIERGSEGDDIAITDAHQAVDAHVEHVRDKLIQLATAVTSPTFALPSAEREEELEAYFARVERVAEEVSAIGITPVEKPVI